jgi:hypothetical protein
MLQAQLELAAGEQVDLGPLLEHLVVDQALKINYLFHVQFQ